MIRKSAVILAVNLALLSIVILLLAQWCYISVGEEPFSCLPLILPSLPFSFIADLLNVYVDDLSTRSWTIVTLGTAVFWFLIVLLVGGVIRIINRK